MCRHDFNENLGEVKVQSFQAKFPEALEDFKAHWVEYMKYCYRVESGEEVDSVAPNRATTILMELDRDLKGFPLVPPALEGDSLAYMKRVIRSFVTVHYRELTSHPSHAFPLNSPGFASGRKQDRVPWKQIKDHTADFIEARYLPEPVGDGPPAIEDPSDMKKEQITRLLEHWRRPVAGSDLFRFSHVLVNSKTDAMMRALYKDLPQNGRVIAQSPGPIDRGTGPDWDAEYDGQHALQFSPSLTDDVNMHPPPHDFDMQENDPEPDPTASPVLHLELTAPLVQQESRAWTPVIDPQLMGLQYQPEKSLVPASSPTVQRPPAKKMNAKKGRGKSKGGARPQPKAKILTPSDTVVGPRQQPKPKAKQLTVGPEPTVTEPVADPDIQSEQQPIHEVEGRPKRSAKGKLDISEMRRLRLV